MEWLVVEWLVVEWLFGWASLSSLQGGYSGDGLHRNDETYLMYRSQAMLETSRMFLVTWCVCNSATQVDAESFVLCMGERQP